MGEVLELTGGVAETTDRHRGPGQPALRESDAEASNEPGQSPKVAPMAKAGEVSFPGEDCIMLP